MSVNNRKLFGWFSYPEGQSRLPAFLWINPYGRESLVPNQYGTRKGFASLNFNFFGYSGFHQEKYRIDRGYFAEGIESPSSYILRTFIQDCIVALKVLESQLEVDESRIGVMGMSQGGGLAIACGALSKVARAVCADMPFFGDIRNTLRLPVHRYPLKEIIDFEDRTVLGRERVEYTLSYFDTAYHASRCSVPTHVTLGLKDPACRPSTVLEIYNQLPGKKQLVELDWGHDWHPNMISSNECWFLEHLKS